MRRRGARRNRIEIEMLDARGSSIFGKIDQVVVMEDIVHGERVREYVLEGRVGVPMQPATSRLSRATSRLIRFMGLVPFIG